MAKTDPYKASEELIANAIGTARVFGENPRITRLVASSVGRFAAELDKNGSPGAALVEHALELISEQDAQFVPGLLAALEKLEK